MTVWLVLLLWLVMRATVAVVILVATLGAGLPAAGALTPEERKRAIAEELAGLREDIDEVAAAELQLIAALEVSRRRTAELDAVVSGLDAELDVVHGELHIAERQLEAADTRHGAVVAELGRTRAVLLDRRLSLRDQAVTAFIQGGRRPSATDLVLHAPDVAQALAIAALADAIVEAQDDLVDETRELEEDTELLEVDAARAEAAAAAQRQAVAEQEASIEAVRAEQATARAQVRAEAAVESALLAEAQAEKAGYEQRTSSLEEESSAITELLRVRAAEQAARDAEARRQAQRVFRAGTGVLGYPVASPTITSGYGYRTHPIFGGRRLHAGMDLRAPTGTPILAAAAGTVVAAGYRGGYGNAVVIDHGGSLATLYAHQSRLAVSAGEQVARGQVVGAAGTTGNSTGPHLHFEVRVEGTPVDPANYL